jgi:hypothetical protein
MVLFVAAFGRPSSVPLSLAQTCGAWRAGRQPIDFKSRLPPNPLSHHKYTRTQPAPTRTQQKTDPTCNEKRGTNSILTMVLPLHPPPQLVDLLEDAMAEVEECPKTMQDSDVRIFLAFLAEGLSNAQIFDEATWQTTLLPYLTMGSNNEKSSAATTLIESYRQKVEEALVEVDDNDSYGEDEEIRESDIIVHVNFNLAYGGTYRAGMSFSTCVCV